MVTSIWTGTVFTDNTIVHLGGKTRAVRAKIEPVLVNSPECNVFTNTLIFPVFKNKKRRKRKHSCVKVKFTHSKTLCCHSGNKLFNKRGADRPEHPTSLQIAHRPTSLLYNASCAPNYPPDLLPRILRTTRLCLTSAPLSSRWVALVTAGAAPRFPQHFLLSSATPGR